MSLLSAVIQRIYILSINIVGSGRLPESSQLLFHPLLANLVFRFQLPVNHVTFNNSGFRC